MHGSATYFYLRGRENEKEAAKKDTWKRKTTPEIFYDTKKKKKVEKRNAHVFLEAIKDTAEHLEVRARTIKQIWVGKALQASH